MLSLALRLSLTTALTSVSGSGVVPFSPSTLFASGEEGAWYEPSTTTAFTATYSGGGFTDIAPAGYGDLCAILLDKSQGAGYSGGSFTGLGSELVTNGDFSAGDTGWTEQDLNGGVSGYPTFTGGVLTIARGTSNDQSRAYQSFSTTVGATYLVYAEYSKLSGTRNVAFFKADDVSTYPNLIEVLGSGSSGVFEFTFVATSTTTYILPGLDNNTSIASVAEIDNISVRELPGNHATQGTESARPILARVPETGRRNTMPNSSDFASSATRSVFTPYDVTGPDGELSAASLIENTDNNSHFIITNDIYTIGSAFTMSVFAKAVGRQYLCLASGNDTYGSYFDLSGSGSVVSSSGAGVVGNIESLPDGWYRCSVYFPNIPSGNMFIALSADGSTLSYQGDGVSGVYLYGMQTEEGSTATAYQKVVDQYDITEAGVTSLEYLAFDGSDDFLAFLTPTGLLANDPKTFAVATEDTDTGLYHFAMATRVDFGGVNNVLKGYLHVVDDTRILYAHAAAGNDISDISADGAKSVVVTTHAGSGGDTFHYRNGSTALALSTSDLTAPVAETAGGYTVIGRQATVYAGGNLFSLIALDRVITDAERGNVNTYLAAKSGVTL